MTGSTALRRHLVLLVALLLVGLTVPTARAATPTAAPAAASHTRLTLRISGCARCRVTLIQAISGAPNVWQTRAQRIGADGRAVFRVPTARTHGMSFELRVPWESAATDSVLNIATRYPGQAVGQPWSAKQAMSSKRGFGCWAGTTKAQARLAVRVHGFTFDAGSRGRQRAAVAWASPGLRSWRPAMRTFHGRIGNQDAFYCQRP